MLIPLKRLKMSFYGTIVIGETNFLWRWWGMRPHLHSALRTMCNTAPGTHRCRDCFTPHFLCDVCCVYTHSKSPFHRVQQFNGRYFEKSDLDALGLVLDLREHPQECISHTKCMEEWPESEGEASSDDDDDSEATVAGEGWDQSQGCFTDDQRSDWRSDWKQSNLIIISSTGIFKRSVRWCTCVNSPDPYVQLIRAKLFPASFKHPETAFTFEVLDHFHIDTLEYKMAAMNFMGKIVQVSNEAFPERFQCINQYFPQCCMSYNLHKDRYRELLRVSREWRDLHNRIRAGAVHDWPDSLVKGGLALFCPACPQVEINTPLETEWNNEDRWVLQ